MTRPNPGGRSPTRLTTDQLLEARNMREARQPIAVIARHFGISPKAMKRQAVIHGFGDELPPLPPPPPKPPAPRIGPDTFGPEAWAEFRRLWTETIIPVGTIRETMAVRFGITMNTNLLFKITNREDIRRPGGSRAARDPAGRVQNAFLRSWLRDTGPKREDNPVRRVAAGTCRVPVGGYRMGVVR